jgi:hypothetical protein
LALKPTNNGYRTILIITCALLLFPAYVKFGEVRIAAHHFENGKQNIKTFKNELALLDANGHIIVFNSFAWQLLYADLLDANEFAQNTNFIAIDNGELYMYPQFKQAMQACCGGYTVAHLANYLVANKDRVVIVSGLERMDLMQRYIETVYGIPFGFEPMPLTYSTILHQPKGGAMMPKHADGWAFSYYRLR